MPLVLAGAGDMLRGEEDVGRAQSRRACVLAAEAVRNLCHARFPNRPSSACTSTDASEARVGGLLDERPLLGEELLSLARSYTTTDRLRGASLEALAALASDARMTAASAVGKTNVCPFSCELQS